MKYFIVTIIYLAIILNSFSQSNKNSLSISLGTSIPIGQFGNSNNKAGYTKIGEHLDISFDHKISKSFSFSFMVYGQQNKINVTTLENEFSNQTFFINFNPLQPIKFSNWKFDKNSWQNGGLLVGGSNEFLIDKKTKNLTLNVKAMLGINYTKSPELFGMSKTDTTQANYSYSRSSGYGLAYLFGSFLKYELNKKYYIVLSAQYLGTTEIKFKDVSEKFIGLKNNSLGSFQTWESKLNVNSSQSVSTININLGIGIKF